MDITKLTIADLQKTFKEGALTSVEVTRAYLDAIEKKDGEVNAYLSVTKELALEQAKAADERIKAGQAGPLTGVPMAVKDAILVQGQTCTAASKMLERYTAPYDATVIKRLKEAGAVILGKTDLDEFAMGGSGENSAFGPSKNPIDTSRVAGGSSSGSAAAVAAEEACYALGSETGGSIRLPSSFTGIVGLKTTYGAVSRNGLIAFGSSLDQIGPMGKTVADVETVFAAISGKDPMDATSAEYTYQKETVPLNGLRIGVPKEYFVEGIDPEVEKVVREAIKKAQDQGATIVEINLPSVEFALACYYVIAPAEASANLARYDGIRYGLSVPSKDLLDGYLKTKGQGFGKEVKRRIMIGTYVLSSGYYDAYYKKAQEVRQLIVEDFQKAFSEVDVIFSPVSPITAPKIGEKAADPLAMYLMDVYTVSANLAGIPALSLPCGKANGMPVGLHIVGKPFAEATILSVASQMEAMLQ